MTFRETDYLSLDDAIGIHDLILESMGDLPAALRDEGLLDSALSRPKHATHYTGVDIITQGCILTVAIAENQPFVEGNKRTGMVCGLTLMERNGWTFIGDDELLAVLLVEAAGKPQEQAISTIDEWIRPYLILILAA